MKRFIPVLMAVFLLCAMGTPVLAYFENNHLVMVVYNADDNEVAVDLGDMDTMPIGSQGVELAPANSVYITPPDGYSPQFGTSINDWGDLRAAFYTAYRTSGVYHFLFATTQGSANAINSAAKANFYNGSTLTHTLYAGSIFNADGDWIAVGPSSDPSSYDSRLNNGGPGQMAGYNLYAAEIGETNLAALETAGYVDMYLYEWDVNGNPVPGAGGDYRAVLRLNANGSVILNPAGGNTPPSIQLLRNGQPVTGSVTISEGESLSITIRATDENGDALSLTSPLPNQLPQGAVLTGPTVSGNTYQWSFNWTPGYEQSGTVSLTFRVSDGIAANSEPLTIQVTDMNQPPSVSVTGPSSVNEGQEITLSIEATDADGDTLGIEASTLANLPEGAVLPSTPDISGEVYRWTFRWTPSPAQAGTYPIAFTVTDGVTPETATRTITVVNVNLPPTLEEIPDQVLADSTDELAVSISAGDEDSIGLALEYQPLSHGSLPGAINVNGPVVDGQTGIHTWTFRWTPGPGISDVYTIGFTVVETAGADPLSSVERRMVVTVGNTNAPPVLGTINDRQTVEAANLVIQLSASDPENNMLTYSVDLPPDMPGGHNARIDESTGRFTWTPQAGDGEGSSYAYQLTFRVTDNGTPARSDDETVNIIVYANRIPGTPSVNNPTVGGQVDSVEGVGLSVNNAPDPDKSLGQMLFYQFQVFTQEEMIPESLLAETVEPLDEDPDGTTEWTIPVTLEENVTYYWKSRVFDGIDYSQYTVGFFIVNAGNEPPGLPVRMSPGINESVANTAPELMIQNAVDPDGDSLKYLFQVGDAVDIENSGEFRSALVNEGNNHSGTNRTSWYVTPALKDNTAYWWRVKASDPEGLESAWIGPFPFAVNLYNDGPSAPVLDPLLADKSIYGGEVATDRPKLIIANAIDPDTNDALTYYFEIIERSDSGCGIFEGESLMQSPAIPEGQMEEPLPGTEETWNSGTSFGLPQDPDHTAWRTPVLNDETHYCWRVWAEDGDGNEGPPVQSQLFVNLANDLPSAAVIKSPLNMSRVGERMPVLEVHPASDSDEDRISYHFALTDESGTKAYSITLHDNTQWQTPEPLSDGVWYWQVKTFDEHADAEGEPSRWSEKAQFTVNINDLPGVPGIHSPANGDTVTDLQPTLRIQNAADQDGDVLTYEFELYNDASLAGFSFIASESKAQEPAVTSWKVPEPLNDGMTYYWRARAFDNEYHSSWTQTSKFKVDSSGGIIIHVEVSQQILAASGDVQIVEVKILDSPIYGVRILVPPGSVSEDVTLTIGYAQNPPVSEEEYVVIGKVLVFGPSGMIFTHPVTIQIPYTQADLDAAGVGSPELLKIYNYIEDEEKWEEIAVSSIDPDAKIISCTVDHFSLYFLGYSRTGQETPDPHHSSGGGGCFIHVLNSRGMQTAFDGWVRLVLGMLIIAGIWFVTALIHRAGYRQNNKRACKARKEHREYSRMNAVIPFFSVLVTAAFVFCSTARAEAYFENSHLVLVVYNSDDNEVGVDLGDMDAFSWGSADQALAGSGSVNLNQFGGIVSDWDDLNMSVYTAYRSDDGAYHFMFATTQVTAPAVNKAANANFYNGSSANHTLMSAEGAEVYAGAAREVSSYTNKLDLGSMGQMAGYNLNNPSLASVNLRGLAAAGFVDMYLYEFDIDGNLIPGIAADYQGVIRLKADGSVVALGQAPQDDENQDSSGDGDSSSTCFINTLGIQDMKTVFHKCFN